ncbi:MAG: hypothetical protein ACM309_09330 [Bacillota bacterium]
MTWNDVGLELAKMLLPVVAALLIALVGYGISYLRKQTQAIENEMARKALNDALTEAEIVATDAIKATNQVLVDALKEKAADGKLTKEEAVAAMNTAKLYFMQHITKGSKDVLEAALGPVSEWLESFLEAKLAGEKSVADARAEVAATVAPLSSGQAG